MGEWKTCKGEGYCIYVVYFYLSSLGNIFQILVIEMEKVVEILVWRSSKFIHALG